MKHYIDRCQFPSGLAATGTQVTVYTAGNNQTVLATIYSDDGVTTIPGSTFAVDSLGNFGFYAADGRYDLKFINGATTIQTDIEISDVTQANNGDALWGHLQWIDIRAYGATTSATDNSTALQNAINAALAASIPLYIPAGTYTYATTLAMNSTNKGLKVFGSGMQPTIGTPSMLKYTGTGSAITLTNGTNPVFGCDWNDFGIIAGANATAAITANNISECTFKRVGIWSDGTHEFTTGWALSGANICFWDGWLVSGLGHTGTSAVSMVDTAQSQAAALYFRNGDTFQTANVFLIVGQVSQISDTEGWHESHDVIFNIDDTTKATNVTGLYQVACRNLFNFTTATYPNQRLLKINNIAGNVMGVHQVSFDHITWFTNQTVAQPISIVLGNASSIVFMNVGGGSSFTGATTSLVNTSMSTVFQLRMACYGIESLNASLTPLGTLVSGTGADSTDLEFGGLTMSNSASILSGPTIQNAILTGAGSGNAVTLLNEQGPAGAITGTGADANVYTFTIPANTMAAGKGIRVRAWASHSSGTASVTWKFTFGATTFYNNATAGAGTGFWEANIFNNAGVQNAQHASGHLILPATTAESVVGGNTAAENTANAVIVKLTFSVANTDQVTPNQFTVELIQ